jgi:aminoglycoside 6-adenylyltransferase
MGQPGSAAEAFLTRFTSWASERPDVRGVLVVGSRARIVEPADPLSDVDLMVVTTRPHFYLSTREWLQELGEPVLACTYSTVVGTRPVISVDFNGGIVPLHVDFAIVGYFESRWGGLLLRLLARRPATMSLLPRGLVDQVESWFDALRKGVPRVLVDKHGAASRMFGFAPPPRERAEPTPAEWDDAVNLFLSLCLWKSKLLRRGERWMAAQVPDRQMKDCLLGMFEWHARATSPQATDTWYAGRFVEKWADPRAVESLPETFGRYHDDDAWRSLFATLDLFSLLGRETAVRTRRVWPDAAERRVRGWLQWRFDDWRAAVSTANRPDP